MEKKPNIRVNKLQAFYNYYMAMSKSKRNPLRLLILAEMYPDRDPSVFNNIITGKKRVFQRDIEKLRQIVSSFDSEADIRKIFPMENHIQRILNRLKVSQTELAVKTGLHQSSISAYVSGTRNPQAVHALLIAKALNVSVEEIFVLPAEEQTAEQFKLPETTKPGRVP